LACAVNSLTYGDFVNTQHTKTHFDILGEMHEREGDYGKECLMMVDVGLTTYRVNMYFDILGELHQ
jgi:hypothetical protein